MSRICGNRAKKDGKKYIQIQINTNNYNTFKQKRSKRLLSWLSCVMFYVQVALKFKLSPSVAV